MSSQYGLVGPGTSAGAFLEPDYSCMCWKVWVQPDAEWLCYFFTQLRNSCSGVVARAGQGWRKGDESVDHGRHQIALGYIASPPSQNTTALTVSPIAELEKVRPKKFREVRRDAPGHTATRICNRCGTLIHLCWPPRFLTFPWYTQCRA